LNIVNNTLCDAELKYAKLTDFQVCAGGAEGKDMCQVMKIIFFRFKKNKVISSLPF
jgi:hypothetical protein